MKYSEYAGRGGRVLMPGATGGTLQRHLTLALLCSRRQSHPLWPSSVRGMLLLQESGLQLLPEVPVSLLPLPVAHAGSALSSAAAQASALRDEQPVPVLPTASPCRSACCLTRPAGSHARGSRSTTSSGSAPLPSTPWCRSPPLPR